MDENVLQALRELAAQLRRTADLVEGIAGGAPAPAAPEAPPNWDAADAPFVKRFGGRAGLRSALEAHFRPAMPDRADFRAIAAAARVLQDWLSGADLVPATYLLNEPIPPDQWAQIRDRVAGFAPATFDWAGTKLPPAARPRIDALLARLRAK